MNRLRLVRIFAALAGAAAGIVLVFGLFPLSAIAGISTAVCLAATAAVIISLEFSLRDEARRRGTLRTATKRDDAAIEARLALIEERVTSNPTERYMTKESLSRLDAYRHQAMLLHRLGAVERALGLGPETARLGESNPKDDAAR
ncbi:hypothetical protein [Agrococcus baldri]|uniref:Uncharacterized protein n=1 Tax=Agrococcus baldri TaxID=153730 RepID=A0AA87RG00_9MICO|nr:hypothetical protein [Agrococcus baldri]GEK79690.1 hypothetical protein ABA31_10410 [Agrococcus baldri]